MGYQATKLCCDMVRDCQSEVTHIDQKGFVYCKDHAVLRKASVNTRKLKPSELTTIQSGKPLERY